MKIFSLICFSFVCAASQAQMLGQTSFPFPQYLSLGNQVPGSLAEYWSVGTNATGFDTTGSLQVPLVGYGAPWSFSVVTGSITYVRTFLIPAYVPGDPSSQVFFYVDSANDSYNFTPPVTAPRQATPTVFHPYNQQFNYQLWQQY